MFRVVLTILLVAALSGCLGGGWPQSGGKDRGQTRVKTRLAVLEGRVIVAGPKGYCIDPEALREAEGMAFVALGGCDSISGKLSEAAPKQRFFLSAAIRPMPSDLTVEEESALPVLQRALERDAVRAALADEVISVEEMGDAMIVQTRINAPAAGLSGDQWRAMFVRRGHVVVLTVAAFQGLDGDGRVVLQKFLEAMIKANPQPAGANGTKTASAGGGLKSLLGRLLN